MSHADSGAGGMTNVGSAASCAHKKMRRKRKELDALVTEDKLRRKPSSSSRHDLLHSDSDDVEFAGRGSDKNGLFGGFLGWVPGICALVILVMTAVGVVATFKLLMATRRDLDLLQMRLNAVEASGSELPAKFHESHVRLQQLEKNHTSLWSTLYSINSNLEAVTEKFKELEINVKMVRDSFSGSPQLSSLPKDISTIQDSVVSFGSSLQDVQSAVRTIKEEHELMQKNVQFASSSLFNIKNDVNGLYNATQVVPAEGAPQHQSQSMSVAFSDLRTRVFNLDSSVSKINSSLFSEIQDVKESIVESLNDSVSRLNGSVEATKVVCDRLENQNIPSKVINMTQQQSILKESSDRHYKLLQNLTQSLAVVKGVEKKLEGSQLQMASEASELRKQLQSLEHRVTLLTLSTSSPADPQSSTQQRLKTRSSSSGGSSNHPRKKRSVPSSPT